MRFDLTTNAGVSLVPVTLDVLDADNADEFKAALQDTLASASKVVLDLSALEFIDSSGLGAILSCLRGLSASGGDLKLAGLGDPVRAIFELVRMHRMLEIHDDVASAMRSFE